MENFEALCTAENLSSGADWFSWKDAPNNTLVGGVLLAKQESVGAKFKNPQIVFLIERPDGTKINVSVSNTNYNRAATIQWNQGDTVVVKLEKRVDTGKGNPAYSFQFFKIKK